MMNDSPQALAACTESTTNCKWMDPSYRGFWFIFSNNIFI